MKSLRARLNKLANNSSKQLTKVVIYTSEAPTKPDRKPTSAQPRVIVYLPDNKRDQSVTCDNPSS